MTRVVLASSNAGKLRELTALLNPLALELTAQSSLGIDSAAETGTTFLENALLKARHAAQRARLPAIADDSGLEVDALGGQPGVWSARFAREGASDEENLRHLVSQLEGVPAGQRQAHYQCVIVFLRHAEDEAPLVARGSWAGHIALAARGRGGFGYDPVFVPEGSLASAGQLTSAHKNAVSHRAQALAALVAMLAAQGYIRKP